MTRPDHEVPFAHAGVEDEAVAGVEDDEVGAAGEGGEAGEAGSYDDDPYAFVQMYLEGRQQKRSLVRFPRLVADALRLVWSSARRPFVLSTILGLVNGIAAGASLLLGRAAVEAVLAADRTGAGLGSALPKLLAVALVAAAMQFVATLSQEQTSIVTQLVSRAAYTRVLDVAASVDLAAFEQPAFYDRLRRAGDSARVRPFQLVGGLIGLLQSGIALAGLGIAVITIEPLLLPMIVAGAIPLTMVQRKISRESYDFAMQFTAEERERSYLEGVITNRDEAKEVRAFALAPAIRARYDALYDHYLGAFRRHVRRRLRLSLLGNVANAVALVAAMAAIVGLLLSDRLDVAGAVAAAAAIQQLTMRVRGTLQAASSMYDCTLFLEDYASFLALGPAVDAARPTVAAPASFETLDVDHVSFSYPGSDGLALDDVSLSIRSGEVVALVGENGSGKTTLAKLLCGLYTPTSGAVRWDGVDISTFDPATVRSSIAVIFQDFVRWQLPARQNVGLGRHERLDELAAIVAAARHAGADSFLRRLPEGYDTVLSKAFKGGRDLSVGQWQRVALARAFFRDASFIVLDEPTAALDPRAEHDLFTRIRSLSQGRTVLLISHRFSSVRSADRIFVLDRGRVTEHGSHDELMAARGTYADLFTLQASAYLGVESVTESVAAGRGVESVMESGAAGRGVESVMESGAAARDSGGGRIAEDPDEALLDDAHDEASVAGVDPAPSESARP